MFHQANARGKSTSGYAHSIGINGIANFKLTNILISVPDIWIAMAFYLLFRYINCNTLFFRKNSAVSHCQGWAARQKPVCPNSPKQCLWPDRPNQKWIMYRILCVHRSFVSFSMFSGIFSAAPPPPVIYAPPFVYV